MTAVVDVGALVVDTASRRVGTLMDVTGGTAWLRPVGGGVEWTAKADDVRPATTAETLSDRVIQANARSKGAL